MIEPSLKYNENNLKELCQKYSLSLVILHGSYVKGAVTANSDIDIGILGESAVIKEKYFEILKDFSLIFGDKFDPVFLNGAESMITYHVAVNGRLLYENIKGLFNLFKLAAISRYMDTRKFRLLEKQYLKSVIQKME